jgi:hypothetical protein
LNGLDSIDHINAFLTYVRDIDTIQHNNYYLIITFAIYIPVNKKTKKEVSVMFVAIINFPPIKEGKDAEFREWFAWSNEVFANQGGLIKRRLLKP